MTVRANKPAFNIREKLKELTHSIGLKGRELMGAATTQEARDLVSAGRRNLVMNGDMQIAQRGTTFANSAGFTLDRWHFGGGSTTGQITVTQESSNSAPGHANYIQGNVDIVDASITGTEYVMCSINIEGSQMRPLCWGTPYAKPATISFWHKHSIAGEYSIILRSTDANYNYLIDYTQNTADVWQKSTFVIKPPTSGSWDKSTGLGLRLGFTMTNGTTYQSSTIENWFGGQYYHSTPNQVQMMQTLNAKFRLTGIQLEVGKNATDFEYRPYGEELALCQRYFRVLTTGRIFTVSNGNGTAIGANIYHPVSMRTTPSPTFYGSNSTTGNVVMYSSEPGTQTNYITAANNFSGAMNGIDCFGWNATGFSPGFPAAASGWVDLGTGANNLKIEFSAEY